MTHHANRQRRRVANRFAVAGPEDLKRYARLAEACRKAALDPGGDVKAVAKARRAVRGRVMPAGQAVRGSVIDQLCRLADRWPGMLGTARIAEAPAMADLARQAAGLVAALSEAADDRLRLDIDG